MFTPHPDQSEEIEYQLHAQADYLSEAFGAEARLLRREDPYEYADQITPAQRTADRTWAEVQRAKELVQVYVLAASDDLCPF